MSEQLLLEIAKQSPLALFGIIVVWRLSIVLIVMAEGLVKIASESAEDVGVIAKTGQNLQK